MLRAKWSVSAFFAKGCVHITNSKQRKHPTTSSRNCAWYVIMELKITPSGQTIVKPTALGPGANTDTKLLIYGLFQKGITKTT